MIDSFTTNLAHRVRTQRVAERLTQADLADLSGVSERFIRSLEHGKPTLQLDSVLAVLRTLGFDLDVTSRRHTAQRAAGRDAS